MERRRKDLDEENDKGVRLALQKYDVAYQYHQKIYTGECIMTVEDLDEALKGLSPTAARKLVHEQNKIWYQGAGWKDVRQPLTQDKKDIPTAYLVERQKWLIKLFVDCAEPRSVWAQIPRPRELAQMTPLPSMGDTLKDAL